MGYEDKNREGSIEKNKGGKKGRKKQGMNGEIMEKGKDF